MPTTSNNTLIILFIQKAGTRCLEHRMISGSDLARLLEKELGIEACKLDMMNNGTFQHMVLEVGAES